MLVLALDTSTPVVSVALATTDGALLAARELEAPNRHGEVLAGLVRDTLAAGSTMLGDVTAVAVGLGPGPFTGLRVGVVTGAAMSDALDVPAYGVCSLDAIASAHGGMGELLVATDARRRQVYWARYDGGGLRVEGPELSPPADLVARFAGQPLTVCGAGGALYRELFAADLQVLPERALHSAARIVELVSGCVRAGAPGEALTPLYLRRPDARPAAGVKKVTPA